MHILRSFIKRAFKAYDMVLYSLQRSDFVSYAQSDRLPENFRTVMLDTALLEKYGEQISKMLHKGTKEIAHFCKAGGVALAFVRDDIVAYGHLKTHKTGDTFYRIGKETAYLSQFYTAPEYRGRDIYPAVISCLVESAPQYDEFFISAYTSNRSSDRGLTKVGFVPIKTVTFIRAFRRTVRKYRISSQRNVIL